MDGTYRTKEVKTRKQHDCDSCKKTISAGSIMLHASGISFDDFNKVTPFSFYICEKCLEEASIDEGKEAYKEHLSIY
jgi:hypothetical protein